ncbi:MAG: MBL fold metallo-hydrolase [Bacteroidales bacterium]|nr:MBL fold metallo-hydrolase [Bacteroidales bacterium]
MLEIKQFVFNPLGENTYILIDDSRDAVIVDPGNFSKEEDAQLLDFISQKGLSIRFILNTHPHVDHTGGNAFCKTTFPDAPLIMSEAGLGVYRYAPHYCVAFGLDAPEFPAADRYFMDNEWIEFGSQKLKVLFTPGHTAGCVSLYSEENRAVFVGDALFVGSVGRTDLPSGNLTQLLESIRTRLLTLPDDTVIYSGHGETTTIKNEKMYNPYLQNFR